MIEWSESVFAEAVSEYSQVETVRRKLKNPIENGSNAILSAVSRLESAVFVETSCSRFTRLFRTGMLWQRRRFLSRSA